jgi:cell division protein FtsZ
MSILTVAVVTMPFAHEGKKRIKHAQEGIVELKQYVDSLIVVPNDKLADLGREMDFFDTFKESDCVLSRAVGGISEIITNEGYINIDFADVTTVMAEMGNAKMGQGIAKGDERGKEATERAIHSPLLEDVDIKGAKGVLFNVIAARKGFSITEFNEIMEMINGMVSDDAEQIMGMQFDDNMEEEVKVTIIATGLGVQDKPELSVVGAKKAKKTVPTMMQADEIDKETLPSYDATGADYFDIPAFLRKQTD